MDRLRQTLLQIQTQLRVLGTSQRIAIGLCAALLAASILWLMQYSTAPDLVAVSTHQFSPEDLQSAEETLRSNGIDYETRGNLIFVRAAERYNALRLLQAAQAIPADQLFDMEAMMADQNPFMSPEQREFSFTYAKGNELAKIIATSPLVESARVLIDPKTRRRLGGESQEPTASVSVTLRPGNEMTMETVDWLAKLVSGAVSGLKPHNVFISDARSGRSYTVPQPGDLASFSYLAEVKKRETHLLEKLMEKLAYIPGVRATVTIELETDRRSAERMRYSKPEVKTETTKSTQMSSAETPAESGVQANLGTAITGGSSGGSSTTEETSTENFPVNLNERELVENVSLANKKVTATVSIPRSFIVGIYKLTNPEAQEPTDDDLKPVRDQQVQRVAAAVAKIVQAKDESDVEVDVVPDLQWDATELTWRKVPGDLMAGAATGPSAGVMDYVKDFGPQAGMALLALFGIFMMLKIARRGAEAAAALPPIHGAEAAPAAEGVLSTEHTVGEAVASAGFLVGKEVDENTLRYEELGQEVSRMVTSQPQTAADLIRRWVKEESK